MEQARLMFLAAMTAAAVALAPALKPPDLTPPDPPASPAAAERDFRGCSGDWIHVADFWTVDVAELYRLTSAATGNADDQAIKLIQLSITLADEGAPVDEK